MSGTPPAPPFHKQKSTIDSDYYEVYILNIEKMTVLNDKSATVIKIGTVMLINHAMAELKLWFLALEYSKGVLRL